MRFDLIDLRLFVHIAEAGSITGGASRSHMTLASASQRVRGMEAVLGVPLLVRSAQGVQPTAAGRTLLRQARQVLQQMDTLRAALAAYGQGLQGQVRLLCNTSAMGEHLPLPLARFLALHPHLSVELEERTSDETVDALRQGQADIGIVSDVADTAGLRVLPFRPDPLVLVLPRGHALAARRGLALAEVAGLDFVGLAAANPLQVHVAQQALRLGLRLHYRARVGGFDAVCRLVGQAIGAGIVPRAAAQRCGRAAGTASVPLCEPWAQRTLLLCSRTGEPLAPHAALLVDALRAPA